VKVAKKKYRIFELQFSIEAGIIPKGKEDQLEGWLGSYLLDI